MSFEKPTGAYLAIKGLLVFRFSVAAVATFALSFMVFGHWVKKTLSRAVFVVLNTLWIAENTEHFDEVTSCRRGGCAGAPGESSGIVQSSRVPKWGSA